MTRLFGFVFAVLACCFLTLAQSSEQNSAYESEYTARHQQYLPEPSIKETNSVLEIRANFPRPLDNIVGALIRKYGWHINYEDPRYGKADIVEDTAPSWRESHPNGPWAYGFVGGAFSVNISIDGHFPNDPMQVLPALVAAYNRSDNPGRFQVHAAGDDEFDVIPTASAEGPQTPILDTVMSFDATDSPSIEALTRFCEALSRQSGYTVEYLGTQMFPGDGRFPHITQHSLNQPAREILRQMYKQVGSADCWRLFFDLDSKKFHLIISPP